MPTAARNVDTELYYGAVVGDKYDVQEMVSLSGLISKRIVTCNIGVEARGWGCRGQAGSPII